MKRMLLPFCIVFCAICLAGCDSVLLQRGATPPAATAQPVQQTTAGEPEDVLRDFIYAWSAEDFAAMYRLIAGRSRELYPRQIFDNRYTEAHSVLRFDGVTHTLNHAAFQGTTAVLNYDIVIASPAFGRVADAGRTMRLVDEGGWKIAWSPMDIFDSLSARARLQAAPTYPRRANIYDRDGKPLAEEDGLVDSLYLTQNDMRNVDACLFTLSLVARQQTNTLRNIFAGYLAETLFHIAEVDPERLELYRERLEDDCGLSVVSRYRARRYYGHGIATHVVGYIGPIPGDQIALWEARGYDSTVPAVGRAGIEYSYEETLAGRPARSLRIVEAGATILRELGGSEGVAPRPVTLTLDRDLQESAAQAMADAVNAALLNWGGITLGGAIVALEINSGEVLAMASYPSFDPHLFSAATQYNVADRIARLNRDVRAPFGNKAIAEQYTPGSVYKIVTLLASATEGIAPAEIPFNCTIEWYGQERYGDARPVRYDWRLLENKPPTGPVSMSGALTTSCNPFFWEIGALMFQRDTAMQANYASLLGFGRRTGIGGLGNEAAGDVALPNPNEPTEAINNAIGQGSVTVTALQMAQATALIANGGKFYQPYIARHIGTPGADDYERINQPTLLRDLALDENALAIVRQGMCDVTTIRDFGTAWWVFEGTPYTVCGKTGTAETAGQPNAWFVAYYPADEPRIAFAGVMANSREGSEVVAPMIRRILDDVEGVRRAPWPEFWSEPFNPLPSQTEALANYDP